VCVRGFKTWEASMPSYPVASVFGVFVPGGAA
jgi:hypothetical protein